MSRAPAGSGYPSAAAAVFAACARDALVEEAALEGKPGLVTRTESGAHADMDYGTFLASARALLPYFRDFFLAGYETHNLAPAETFSEARRLGREAEAAMFRATRGVNTHKGLIFSLGLLLACAGRLRGGFSRGGGREGRFPRSARLSCASEALCREAAAAVRGLTVKDFSALDAKVRLGEGLTKGERLFLERGTRGVRGEAESGFQAVRRFGLPLLRRLRSGRSPQCREAVLLDVLTAFMIVVEDTNVLGRGGTSGLAFMRASARKIQSSGGAGTSQGRAELGRTAGSFRARGLSPGGCADLLAVTLFLEKADRAGAFETITSIS